MASDAPFTVPLRVLQDRHPLTITEALCFYLCDDPGGPRLTNKQAAQCLGFADRGQVATHRNRARAKQSALEP